MNINSIWPPKTCTRCGEVKAFSDFGVHSFIADKMRSECLACASLAQRNRRKSNTNQKEIDRKFNLRHGFGMTVEEYDVLWMQQKGVCAICKRPETVRYMGELKRLAIDHCHTTNTNRGLLCSKCNVAIGYFGESVESLKSAIAYLQKHQQ